MMNELEGVIDPRGELFFLFFSFLFFSFFIPHLAPVDCVRQVYIIIIAKRYTLALSHCKTYVSILNSSFD